MTPHEKKIPYMKLVFPFQGMKTMFRAVVAQQTGKLG